MKTSAPLPATHKMSVRAFLLLLVVSITINGINCKKNKRSDLGGTSDGSWKLVKVEPKEIRTLSDLTDGVYAVQISGGRSESCGLGSGELLGFNNRTCSVSLSPSTTAGPVMRQVSRSQMWREWMVRVEKNDGGVEKKVTLQAFVDPDVGKKAKCLGYMSSFYGNPSYPNACSTPPYGTGVFLNGTKDSITSSTNNGDGPQIWSVRAVAGKEGDFEMHASSKPEESCARILSLNGCEGRPSLAMMGSSPNNEGSQIYSSWKLIKQYDMISTTPPPPPPSPPPSVVPSGPPFIPGPVISGPSTTSSGYVTVTIKEIGGGNGCSVGSIVVTSTGGAIGSVPATVEVSVSSGVGQGVQVPVKADGYNSIYAIGVCTSGGNTEISNGLSVFSSSLTPGPSSVYPVTIVMAAAGGYTPSNQITDADKEQICTNLLTEAPGGVCEVVNDFLEMATLVNSSVPDRRRSLATTSVVDYLTIITVTATYSSNSSVTEIVNAFENGGSTFTGTLFSGLTEDFKATFPVGLNLSVAPQIPVVTTVDVTDSSWTGSWADTWSKDAQYYLSCSSSLFVTSSEMNATTATSNTLTGLDSDTTYYCSVQAEYPAQVGYVVYLSSNYVEIKTKNP